MKLLLEKVLKTHISAKFEGTIALQSYSILSLATILHRASIDISTYRASQFEKVLSVLFQILRELSYYEITEVSNMKCRIMKYGNV